MQLEDYFTIEKFEHCERIRVQGTRVAIDHIIEDYQQGMSPETIAVNYPTVTLEQVFATLTYYLHNKPEVDAYLQRGREHGERLYQEYLKRERPEVVKRLIALRNQPEVLQQLLAERRRQAERQQTEQP
jgi:uncharacterized protein (DUF433 family)